jgi:hypothetical protein
MRIFELRRLLASGAAALSLIALGLLLSGYHARQRHIALMWVRQHHGLVSFETPRAVPLLSGYPLWRTQLVRQIHMVGQTRCDLNHLSALRETRELFLTRMQLDAGSLRELGRFRQLERLSIDQTAFDNEALQSLRGCRRLKRLDLEKTHVTNAGLESLAKLPLIELNLRSTRISDAGLEFLADLPLTKLNLRDTGVTDAGLQTLRKIRTLRELVVESPGVTVEGVRQLVADTGLESAAIEIRNPGKGPRFINVGTNPPVR